MGVSVSVFQLICLISSSSLPSLLPPSDLSYVTFLQCVTGEARFLFANHFLGASGSQPTVSAVVSLVHNNPLDGATWAVVML